MKKFRLVITTMAIFWLCASNHIYAQWETMMTDIIPSGIYISPDYSRDRTLFVLDNNIVLWRSSNQGHSWVKVLTAENQPELMRMVISPDFANDGTAFVIKNNGEVMRSTDSGLTWAPMPGLPANVTGLACRPLPEKGKNIYTLTGSGGPENLFVSENDGDSWLLLQNLSVAAEGYPGLWISGETASGGFLALQSEKDIFMSADGGLNLYHSFNQGFEISLSDVVFSPAFSQDSTLFISDWKYVWKNNHAGNPDAWIKSQVQTENMPISLAISPAYQTDKTIYATSSEKVIKRSFDGGNTWENCGIPLNLNTSRIAITGTDPYIIFLGLTNDDMTSGKLLKSEPINGSMDIPGFQQVSCYPNPASGETKLIFTTRNRCGIMLDIFDVLGNNVRSINLGECSAGVQSVTIPLTGNLANIGFYFCRLQCGGDLYTVKLAVK